MKVMAFSTFTTCTLPSEIDAMGF